MTYGVRGCGGGGRVVMERASGGAERRRGEAPPNTPGDEDKQIL